MSEQYIKKLEGENQLLLATLVRMKKALYFMFRDHIRQEGKSGTWGNPDLDYGDFIEAVENNFARIYTVAKAQQIKTEAKEDHQPAYTDTETLLIYEFINKLEHE